MLPDIEGSRANVFWTANYSFKGMFISFSIWYQIRQNQLSVRDLQKSGKDTRWVCAYLRAYRSFVLRRPLGYQIVCDDKMAKRKKD